jgi:hypothetical protein
MSLSFSATERPRIVTSIGTLRLLYGILAIAFGLVIAYSPTAYLNFTGESESDYVSEEELGFVATFTGILIGSLGVAGVIIAIATLLGKRRAWIANVIFASLLIVIAASDIALGYYSSALGILFNGFILAYMFSKPVKSYFGKLNPSSTPVAANTAAA